MLMVISTIGIHAAVAIVSFLLPLFSGIQGAPDRATPLIMMWSPKEWSILRKDESALMEWAAWC